MKFLDTNVIAKAFYDNPHRNNCQKEISKGGLTNTFVLAETFESIFKVTKDKERAERAVRAILQSQIMVIEINQNILFESIKRISKFNLDMFDMIHYVCALIEGCESIVSYDTDFDNLDIPREEP